MVSNAQIIYLVIILGCILISMTLHEAMHAFVSYWLGDDTAKEEGRLTLNPLAHIDPITTVALPLLLVLAGLPPFGAAKPVPFNPSRVRFGDYGAALVGLAGPLTNLALAIVGGIILSFVLPYGWTNVIYGLGAFIIVNVSFFVFNLIPFPPLDGSRALYAVAPDFVRTFMETIESMGFMAIMAFMLLFYAFLAAPFAQVVSFIVSIITGV